MCASKRTAAGLPTARGACALVVLIEGYSDSGGGAGAVGGELQFRTEAGGRLLIETAAASSGYSCFTVGSSTGGYLFTRIYKTTIRQLECCSAGARLLGVGLSDLLITANANGGARSAIVNVGAGILCPRWSREGRSILRSTDISLRIVALYGGRNSQHTPARHCW